MSSYRTCSWKSSRWRFCVPPPNVPCTFPIMRRKARYSFCSLSTRTWGTNRAMSLRHVWRQAPRFPRTYSTETCPCCFDTLPVQGNPESMQLFDSFRCQRDQRDLGIRARSPFVRSIGLLKTCWTLRHWAYVTLLLPGRCWNPPDCGLPTIGYNVVDRMTILLSCKSWTMASSISETSTHYISNLSLTNSVSYHREPLERCQLSCNLQVQQPDTMSD